MAMEGTPTFFAPERGMVSLCQKVLGGSEGPSRHPRCQGIP